MNKKWIVLVLILAAMLLMTGCGREQGKTPEATAVPGTEESQVGGAQGREEAETTAEATAEPAATAEATATATPAVTAAATEEPTKAPEEDEKVELPEFGTTEYEKYLAMSASQQEKFIKSFDSVVDFVNWYNDALDEYQKLHPDIEIDGGEIDLGDVFGGN